MPVHAPFCDVETALEELRAGRMLVVVDDEDRENEGDLTMAAECITPEAINFMATHGRGLICLAMTPERCDTLHLPLVSPKNTSRFGTPSANRSMPPRASPPESPRQTGRIPFWWRWRPTRPADLARPGHVFPLRAREGGVLVRAGQTEASVDLARWPDSNPAASSAKS